MILLKQFKAIFPLIPKILTGKVFPRLRLGCPILET
jgi:hypothetical protein